MSEALLEVTGLGGSYGRIPALRDAAISVGAGQITSVVGANGAGKTTLLRMLVGAHRPDAGTVRYAGDEITRWSPSKRVRNGRVLVPEGRGIIGGMTVMDNLRLGQDAGRKGTFTLADVLERFPILDSRQDRLAGLLSGGEQQMLAIGRALLTQPRVLMLDEPSLGLAPKITQELMRLLASLRDEGLTILLVEQNVRQAMRISDSYYLMETGRVVAHGDPADAAGAARIQAAYLGGH